MTAPRLSSPLKSTIPLPSRGADSLYGAVPAEGEKLTGNHDAELKRLCAYCKEGSFATRAQRARMLPLIADQLWRMGYRTLDVHGLKRWHVNRLVARWQAEHLSPGTMTNRVSASRW